MAVWDLWSSRVAVFVLLHFFPKILQNLGKIVRQPKLKKQPNCLTVKVDKRHRRLAQYVVGTLQYAPVPFVQYPTDWPSFGVNERYGPSWQRGP